VTSPLLQAGFSKRFVNGPVIRADPLTINAPGVTVLFGPSGSGKTTVLRCLAGLETPETGTITFAGEIWFGPGRKPVPPRKRRIGLVPQNYALFPHLTVAQNIAYGLHGLESAEITARIAQNVDRFGLGGLENRRPAELSGGQQQRTALARALARRPALLLLDEPLAALDSPTRLQLRRELHTLLTALALPTLLVTHDRLEAATLGDSIVVLGNGTILQQGPVAEVFNRPASVAVAGIVGADTVLECEISGVTDGLACVLVGTARLTAVADPLRVSAGRAHLCIRAEDVILSREDDRHSSARNRLAAIVVAITEEGPLARLELDCGFPLKALLTRQACAELGLRPGDRAVAMIKAPQVHLI
jgi:molybdate transport system ATP-binding protein